MASKAGLHFLQPFTFQLCVVKRTASYGRFYSVAKVASRRYQNTTQSSVFSSGCSRRVSSDLAAKKPDEEVTRQQRVHGRRIAVQRRIDELDAAKSLAYPRIVHESPVLRVPDFRDKYEDITSETPASASEEVTLYGRIQSVRRAGSKLVFLDIVNEFERVQGLLNVKKLRGLENIHHKVKDLARLLSRGDIVSITGLAVRTPAGELTLEITRLPKILSPSLAPLPETLTDEETKSNYRHMDFLVNRQTVDHLRLRSYIIRYMRDFLDQKNFLEFQTPIVADYAGGAVARPFLTAATEFPAKELALRIAPELWLKRLVVGGVEKVFEIGPAFRNEGIDQSHNPEFTICEFYSAYTSLPELINLTEELVAGLAQQCSDLISTKLGSLPPVDLSHFTRPFPQLEFIPALESRLGFKLPDLSSVTALHDLTAALKSSTNFRVDPTHSLPKLLDSVASEYLEPDSNNAPLFITHHPACMSPLAKSFICPTSGQLVSARTELFIKGKEIANMYEEENDPAAQKRKFQLQLELKTSRLTGGEQGKGEEEGEEASIKVDESYLEALESGLPPTGGWGCGIERLVMLFSGARRIADCMSFGTLKNVVSVSYGRRES